MNQARKTVSPIILLALVLVIALGGLAFALYRTHRHRTAPTTKSFSHVDKYGAPDYSYVYLATFTARKDPTDDSISYLEPANASGSVFHPFQDMVLYFTVQSNSATGLGNSYGKDADSYEAMLKIVSEVVPGPHSPDIAESYLPGPSHPFKAGHTTQVFGSNTCYFFNAEDQAGGTRTCHIFTGKGTVAIHYSERVESGVYETGSPLFTGAMAEDIIGSMLVPN